MACSTDKPSNVARAPATNEGQAGSDVTDHKSQVCVPVDPPPSLPAQVREGQQSELICPQLGGNVDHINVRPARHKTSFTQLASIIDSNVEFKHVPTPPARSRRRRALSLDTPPSSGRPSSVHPSRATEAAAKNIKISRNM